MSYNNDGGCCGGWGGPFGGLMNGFGGFGFDALILLLFFGLMGGGMWGGFGGFGGGFGGYGGFQQATTTAAETAALVGQQQVADRVAGIATGVDAVAGLVTAQSTKLETVKDAVVNGFYANQTNLCQSFNNVAQQFNALTMQGINNHNNLTSQLTDMRFAQQQCCCDTKNLIQSSFCDLRHQMQSDKCDTMQAIANSQAAILAQLNADKFDRMQDKLAAANERNAELKARIDNSNQTQTLLAAIQANGCAPRACAPTPCGPCSPYRSNCEDPVCTLVNSLVTRWANSQEIPAVPATA